MRDSHVTKLNFLFCLPIDLPPYLPCKPLLLVLTGRCHWGHVQSSFEGPHMASLLGLWKPRPPLLEASDLLLEQNKTLDPFLTFVLGGLARALSLVFWIPGLKTHYQRDLLSKWPSLSLAFIVIGLLWILVISSLHVSIMYPQAPCISLCFCCPVLLFPIYCCSSANVSIISSSSVLYHMYSIIVPIHTILLSYLLYSRPEKKRKEILYIGKIPMISGAEVWQMSRRMSLG